MSILLKSFRDVTDSELLISFMDDESYAERCFLFPLEDVANNLNSGFSVKFNKRNIKSLINFLEGALENCE